MSPADNVAVWVFCALQQHFVQTNVRSIRNPEGVENAPLMLAGFWQPHDSGLIFFLLLSVLVRSAFVGHIDVIDGQTQPVQCCQRIGNRDRMWILVGGSECGCQPTLQFPVKF